MKNEHLCTLCVLPASQTVRVVEDALGFEVGDVAQTCSACGGWMVRCRLASSVGALPSRMLG